jgi:cytochrome c
MKKVIVVVGFSICLFAFSLPYPQHVGVAKNTPPKVEIIVPKNAESFEWNSQLRYSIKVTDAEDGSSEYEEINPKEVFLEVIYFADSKTEEKALRDKFALNKDPQGLALIKTSACFNCHSTKERMTGPSFAEVSRHYPHNQASIDTLSKRIIRGTTGVWTKEMMPPHPELTKDKSTKIVQWILKNAEDPQHDYYIGTEGTFRTTEKQKGKTKGAYMLIASYVDHGLKDVPNSNLRGQDMIVLHSK